MKWNYNTKFADMLALQEVYTTLWLFDRTNFKSNLKSNWILITITWKKVIDYITNYFAEGSNQLHYNYLEKSNWLRNQLL